jgi:hypothetical protein
MGEKDGMGQVEGMTRRGGLQPGESNDNVKLFN